MRVSGPALEPLTLSEVTDHLRVTGSAENAYILRLVSAARTWWERTYGRILINQTWDESFAGFPTVGGFLLSKAPVSSVTSVTYHGENLSTSTVFASSNYQVDTSREPGRIVIKNGSSWPTDSLRLSSGVVVRYVAGYGAAAESVPEAIRHALQLLVGQMYTHREPQITGTIIQDVGFAVDALSDPYRVWWH